MITLKMLAAECDVSVATVSKALNGATDVNQETAARIRKAAEDMGYVPSAAARYLKTNRSYSIGVIMEDGTRSGLTHEHFAHVLDGFLRRAEALGYDATLFSAHPGPWGPDYLAHARYRSSDGVAVLVADQSHPGVVALKENGYPLVTLDHKIEGCSCIYSDNRQGMRDLVNYIISQGHTKVAAIFGEESSVTKIRRDAFIETMKENGLEIPDEYIVEGRYHDVDATMEAARKVLSLENRPTCILFPDDFSFSGGIKGIESMGLKVGKDISIAGFDGTSIAKAMNYTTVAQNTRAMGEAMAQALIDSIEKGEGVTTEKTIPCELLKGETVRRI